MVSVAISRAELQAMDRDELIEFVLELSHEVDELEQELKDRTDAAGKDRAEIRKMVHEEISTLEEDLREEISERTNKQARDRSTVKRRLANVEDELGFEDDDVVALAEGGKENVRESDLAKLLEVGPQGVTKRPSEVYYRAEVLARNWIRWGQSKENNEEIVERTLATKRDDLKTRLEDARDESLSWKQVYRAMKKVDDLSPENITLTERTQGKMLVQRLNGGSE